MVKKVGIYSGTFDPVHDGHIAFAREAIKQGKLDKVFFLVEPRPRRKQGVKALEHRLRMVQLAIADDPNMGSVVLDQGRFSVVETLPLLQARFKGAQLYFLLGDDMLKHFNDHDWPHVDTLLEAVAFIIGVRHEDLDAAHAQIRTLGQTRGHKLRFQLFESPKMEMSSSRIQAKLRKNETVQGLPASVQRYIAEHKLYVPNDPSRSK